MPALLKLLLIVRKTDSSVFALATDFLDLIKKHGDFMVFGA